MQKKHPLATTPFTALRIVLLMALLVGLLACSPENTITLDSSYVYKNAEKKVTVYLGTDSAGIRDHSFNAMAWRGITRFYGDSPENPSKRGQLYEYFISKGKDQHESNLRAAADSGYDLIIVAGDVWFDSLNQIAKEFPQQKFMIIYGVELPNKEKNIMQVTYADEQGSFLAGIAAALKAKEMGLAPKFGFIGGMAGPVITRFEAGYLQGIKTISPEAQVLIYYADSWTSPEKAQAQAKKLYDQGVYVIFSAAGFTGNGALEEAKKRRRRGEDVWVIGVDSDQYKQGLYAPGKSAVLTSMTKRLDAVVQFTLWNLASGKFSADTLTLNLSNGGVGLPQVNPNLSGAVMQEVETYKKKVIDGEIVLVNNVGRRL